jgi:hypothetical protein
MWNERLPPAAYAWAAVVLVAVLLIAAPEGTTADEPPHA